jgi:tRNA(Arg) A34 adenosine deaminase TadA
MHMKLTTKQSESWMLRVLELAQQSVTAGNHPFGALLVLDDAVVVEAENTVNSDSDVTRHAEMNAISQACSTMSENDLGRSILFTSTEPCAMCAGALYWAGIKTVVYACSAKRLGEIAGASLKCHSRDIFDGAINPPEVFGPLLEDDAAAQHMAYWPQL